jgi:parallel beta-helix repeat protein
LSPAGVFSGTPATSGTSTYSVGVSDATGQTASASLGLTIAAAPSSGALANYYVSPSGSDSNPCTQSSPCATPDYVVNNKAAAGDTVQVAAGTYDYGSSEVHFTKSGAAGNYVTLTCATRGACKIQNSVTGNSTVVGIFGSYFTFDGFEVTNVSSAGNNIGIYAVGSFLNITHNKIHHIEVDCTDVGGAGIGTGAGTQHDITMDSNLIYDIGWPDGGSPKCGPSVVQIDGIITETTGANMVFTNNIIYHVSGGWGLAPGSNGTGGPPVVVSNNLVFSNSNGGILIEGGSAGSTVTNNLVFNNGVVAPQCGIMWDSSNPMSVTNNITSGNNGGEYCYTWGTQISNPSGNSVVAPSTVMVNWNPNGGGDYHQKAGSPSINAGTSSTGAPAKDFDGNPRPQGAGYDVGAYESPN